jgi:hypothetical protein
MPVSICPRCKHVNPEYAEYCHFDGVVLEAKQNAAVHRLPNEFVFPSGRRCRTFDDLAQGCQEEWTAARDLLLRGVFGQFFGTCNRADLVRAANDAKAQANLDIALTTFLISLPGARTQTPKLDLHPRRILLGNMLVGETKTVPLTVTNQGQGVLQGTVTVSEGQDWLSLSETKPMHEADITTVREQLLKLTINSKGVAAGQTYGGKLTVVTNGGVVEVPLRMDVVAQPFAKAPFQGVRSQRDLADKMRQHPKVAGPILESGEVQRWFAQNGWTFPVEGTPIKGVGGVQQFFEGMGVSKPPPVQLSQTEFRFTCKYREMVRGQVTLQTEVKKWVFAQVSSDSPWLKATLPQVSGPRHATVPFEIDTNHWHQGAHGEGKLTLLANGGQKLTLKVAVEVQNPPAIQTLRPAMPAPPAATQAPPAAIAAGPPPFMSTAITASPAIAQAGVKFVPALMTTIFVCLTLRVLLIPFVDLMGRSSVAANAAIKLGIEPKKDSKFEAIGGWLELPWLPILGSSDPNAKFPAEVFQPGSNAEVSTLEFRHYFASYFIRWFVLRTWWIGAIFGVIFVLQRGGGALDVPWGVVAGAFAGFAVSATLAAFFLVAEMIPHTLWHLAVGGAHGGVGFLVLWTLVAVFCWLLVGIALGIVLPLIGPLRRLLINPFQGLIAGGFRVVGMRTLATYWTP